MFFVFLAKKVVDLGRRIREPEYKEINARVARDARAREGKRGEFLTGLWDGLCGFLSENLSVKPINFFAKRACC